MANLKKTDSKKADSKKPARDPDMPDGFEPLGMTRVDGWFVRKAGNALQGTIQDSFVTKGAGKFKKDRKVYKIQITGGETEVMNADGELVTIDAGLVGIDETGYLKKLGDLEKGREVFVKCKGKEEPDEKESPWIFAIGVVPF
jgi:hypothetical protein